MLLKYKFKLSLLHFAIFLLSFITLYLVNLVVANNYDDNILYSKAYNQISTLTLYNAYEEFKFITGASEPIYFLLSYISSRLSFSYIQFIFITNIFFLYFFYITLKKYFRNYISIYVITLLTNFYLYVFLSDIHRLKVALIVYMIYLISSKYSMMALSLLTHFQMILFILYDFFIRGFSKNSKTSYLILSKKTTVYFLLIGLSAITIGIIFYDQLLAKMAYYLQLSIPWRVVILCFIYIVYLYFFNLKQTLKLFYPLMFLIIGIAIIIGADRVNFLIMEFIFFIELNRSMHKHFYAVIFVTPLIVYNLIKTIYFIYDGVSVTIV